MIKKIKAWWKKQEETLHLMDDLEDWFNRLPIETRLAIFNQWSLKDCDEQLAYLYQK